jgi:hypothetical protein
MKKERIVQVKIIRVMVVGFHTLCIILYINILVTSINVNNAQISFIVN